MSTDANTARKAHHFFVLHRVPYDLYARLRDEPANRHTRMNYYDGTLELMSPEYRHEKGAVRLGTIVRVVTVELKIPCTSSRLTTFRRSGDLPLKGRAKEPDESFYLANEPRIRDKDAIDLEVDPPPDLWIEVDTRGSSLGKLPVYAALGVPEVWRYRPRRGVLWFGRLGPDGYESIDRSLALPMLSPAPVLEALAMSVGQPESSWERQLQAWARERFGPRAEQD